MEKHEETCKFDSKSRSLNATSNAGRASQNLDHNRGSRVDSSSRRSNGDVGLSSPTRESMRLVPIETKSFTTKLQDEQHVAGRIDNMRRPQLSPASLDEIWEHSGSFSPYGSRDQSSASKVKPYSGVWRLTGFKWAFFVVHLPHFSFNYSKLNRPRSLLFPLAIIHA